MFRLQHHQFTGGLGQGGGPDSAGLLYLLARAGNGGKPGSVKLQCLPVNVKTGSRPCQSGHSTVGMYKTQGGQQA